MLKNNENIVVNDYQVQKEFNIITSNMPNDIRWAYDNGKLNMKKEDFRLVKEVMSRPHMPEKVKNAVKTQLQELAGRIQAGDYDDDDDDDDDE